MTINYRVEAEVVDIRQDVPRATDTFLVDTNVWYWLTYTRSSQCTNRPRHHQTTSYPRYMQKALQVKAGLFGSGLSLSELAHLIERDERDIFMGLHGGGAQVNAKEFRHNHPAERARVVAEIQTAWKQVEQFASLLDTMIDQACTTTVLTKLSTFPLDGYDLFLLEAMSGAGITQVITDDGDFAVVPGIRVFTANRTVIEVARQAGKLVQR